MIVQHKEQSSGRSSIVTWGSLIAAATIAITLVVGASSILNWQYTESNNLRKELTKVQVDIANTQVTKPEFQQSMQGLKSEFKQSLQEFSDRFDRGFDKLEKRLDAQRFDPQRFVK